MSAEPYALRIWDTVRDPFQLAVNDVVRIKGAEQLFWVRAHANANTPPEGKKFRLRPWYGPDEEMGENVFYHDSIVFLIEAGLLERRLFAEIAAFDVWANETDAYSHQGGGKWLRLVTTGQPYPIPEPDLPDDLALVWRRKDLS